jgi:hypothetical protein
MNKKIYYIAILLIVLLVCSFISMIIVAATPAKYPDLSKTKLNTPAERSLAGFLLAWKNKQWKIMAGYTQKTWLSNQIDPADLLKNWYDFKDLLGAEIIKRIVVDTCVEKITAKIYYKFEGKVYVKLITALVIAESAPMHHDPNGLWGVEPASCLRED